MKKTIKNWTYQNVTEFLQDHDFFSQDQIKGPPAWMRLGRSGEPKNILDLEFSKGPYKRDKLEAIIRDSGIPEEEWVKWGESKLLDNATQWLNELP